MMARNQQLDGVGHNKMITHEMGRRRCSRGERWMMMIGGKKEEAEEARGCLSNHFTHWATWWRSLIAHFGPAFFRFL